MPRSSPIHPRPPSCAELLKALADESRLAVVQALLDGPLHVHELAAALGIEQSLLSHHLRALRAAGIVEAERDGKAVLYALTPAVAASRRGKEPRLDLGCCQLTFR
jgi:DNA-binding transcriptional ArsR family regulator